MEREQTIENKSGFCASTVQFWLNESNSNKGVKVESVGLLFFFSSFFLVLSLYARHCVDLARVFKIHVAFHYPPTHTILCTPEFHLLLWCFFFFPFLFYHSAFRMCFFFSRFFLQFLLFPFGYYCLLMEQMARDDLTLAMTQNEVSLSIFVLFIS